jgi:PhnB protein
MAAKKMATHARAAARKLAGATKERVRKVISRRRVQAIPKGFHGVTPHLTLRGASEAIEFYKKAFGARERSRMPGPDGKVMHAEIQIGDSIVMLADEFPEMGAKSPQTLGGASGSLLIYTRDVDGLFQRAVAAGATVQMPVSDMFWGDRYGKVLDPFGHQWELATHKEDVPRKEMERRVAAMTSGPPPAGPA